MNPKRLYLHSPILDYIFMGGASILLLPLFFFLPSPGVSQFSQNLAIFLLWFGNWPHFASTLQRLYSSRDTITEYPISTLVFPFVAVITATMALQDPTTTGSFLVKIYTLWAPFHFCGQSLGISLLYCRRAGVQLSFWERRFGSFLTFAPMWVLIAQGESFPWTQKLSGISFQSLQTPKFFIPIAFGFFFFSLIGFITLLIFHKRKLPAIVFTPIISQILWYLVGPSVSAYNELVPFFHSIQYLPIIFYYQWSQSQSKPTVWKWYRLNFLLGAVLFWGIPILLTPFGIAYGVAKGVVFATINLHHFAIDGVIWKLRNSRVARNLIPLEYKPVTT